MVEIYILAMIGYVALVYVVMKIAVFFVDTFILKYTERDEKKMIHELIEDSTGGKLYKESDKDI